MSATQETTVSTAGPTISANSLVNDNEYIPVNSPSSFRALKKPELLKAAAAFAVDVDEDAGVGALRVALENDGITWAMYAETFKIPGWENLKGDPDAPVEDLNEKEVDEVTEVATAPIVPVLSNETKWLVKFVGKNPYFEHNRFKFTQDKPYAIMTADQAQDVLETEPKNFRQAYPKELQEFYS